MHTIGAVFRSRDEALSALRALGALTLRRSRLGLLTPGRDRASLGEAAVAGTIPGIGPVVALGELRVLLATPQAEAAEASGPPSSRPHPHAADDVDALHEAVRRGCSVVMVLLPDDDDDDDEVVSTRESLLSSGEALDDARHRWEDEAEEAAIAAAILFPS